MNIRQLQVGLPVVTARELGDMLGSSLSQESLRNREVSSPGVIDGPHPEHNGDVWLVDHGNGKRAAYHREELQFPKGALVPAWLKNQ